MSFKVNKETYEKIIREDLQWIIKNTNPDLEQKHIISVLNWSVTQLYPDNQESTINLNAISDKDIDPNIIDVVNENINELI